MYKVLATEYVENSTAQTTFKKFGLQIVATILQWPLDHSDLKLVNSMIKVDLYKLLRHSTGERQESTTGCNYTDTTLLKDRIARLNQMWYNQLSEKETLRNLNEGCRIAEEELRAIVEEIALSWLPARQIVMTGYSTRFKVHESGLIMYLPQYCPFHDHLTTDLVLYVIFEDSNGDGFRVRAVPNPNTGRIKPFRESWRGLRDKALCRAANIDSLMFVHLGGFIAGALNLESALKLAEASL